MKLVLAFVLASGLALAQTDSSSTNAPGAAKPPVPKKTHLQTAAQLQAALDQLSDSNRQLLDLLKQQQQVLEDIQYDRRLQSRQIQSLEERLADSQMENAQLQKQVTALETEKSLRESMSTAPAVGPIPLTNAASARPAPPAAPATNSATDNPPPPETYLPPPDSEGAPGTMSWHRLFTLKGDDGRQSDLFHIQGRTWRVVWHNQDKPGKVYEKTSALFINAFPRDDTIPQKVCAQLGTGGDKTELVGPGNYYLKIEASGGSWELAVEDFR